MTELEFIRQARWLAERRGFKSSWPYVAFKARYGRWPGQLLKDGDPMPATPAFLQWVREYWSGPETNHNQAR